ncbi:glycosyltransferase family 4 protein [Sphingobacterium griseoflavum]|uniref:Glycosyl transferase n=1 Tax=Sphingobacterium griseoflavum TaxID=1474952 RepID=A0ABQ3HZ72_9SPHI|nr:glycosyltransferase family 4 protein [Sphingobacterium griseoflavum]GHE38946.1 glycosyl transferase [Sphingobacterium griseoflavum]
MEESRSILIVTNVDWFLISHRLVLAEAALKAGWRVYVACEDSGRSDEIRASGAEFIPFTFSRSGTNIIQEARLFFRFKELYKRLRPDVVHQITIKPVVYGSLAARLEGIPGIVNAISGLGYMFAHGEVGVFQRFILRLMKIGANRRGVSFIFQNDDDRSILTRFNVLNQANRVEIIKGSGVDLKKFGFSPLPDTGLIKILLPCRMLWDKGVKELREASELLKARYSDKIQFVLVGMADDKNKAGVPETYLRDWDDGKYVVWMGQQSDMVKFYRACHIVVLPSYREGLPKTLIEACAIGRPIVTTDAVGCKDCVDQGVNGIKVPVKDSSALATALEEMINNRELMIRMGSAGREKAEKEFDVVGVIDKHLQIYNSALKT